MIDGTASLESSAPLLPGASSQSIVDLQQWINSRPVSRGQWLILALCFIVAVLDGLDAAIMGFVAPALMHDWSITPAVFGSVMGAAMFGLACGALAAGPCADRFGRKGILLGAVACFGIFGLLSAYANSIGALAVLRFLTGMGLGAAMPIANVLLCEYLPSRRRGFLMTLMYTGFNLGSGCGGFISAWLIPSHGWQGTLIFAGVLPLLMVFVLFLLLPESIRFLALRKGNDARIATVLRRYGGSFAPDTHFVCNETTVQKPGAGQLFRNGYTSLTLKLWITNFMGLLVIYLLTGWLPTLLGARGIDLGHAAVVTAMFQIGGTAGALLVGWLMDRTTPRRVIAGAYAAGAVSLVLLGVFGQEGFSLIALVTAAGFCMSGAQTGLNAHAPILYPTLIRGTGVSWMLGVGRFGAIVGSSVGVLLATPLGASGVIALLCIPALLAGTSMVGNRPRPGERRARP